MKIVLGLGNPGRAYRFHRHNAGFRVIDSLLSRLPGRARRRKVRGLAEAFVWERGPEPLMLVKPLTFMNLSGRAARWALAETGAGVEDLIVVLDDIDLPVGRIRVRAGGSAAGQRGMASIIAELGTRDVCRVRIGVGRPEDREDVIDYVLSVPPSRERELLEAAYIEAADAVETLIELGFEAAANRFNG